MSRVTEAGMGEEAEEGVQRVAQRAVAEREHAEIRFRLRSRR
jgi:hypothetical protein